MCLFYKIQILKLYIHTRFAWNHRTVISWRIQAATWQVQIRVDSEARGEWGMVDIEEWVSHTLYLTLCSTQPTHCHHITWITPALYLSLSEADSEKLAARSFTRFDSLSEIMTPSTSIKIIMIEPRGFIKIYRLCSSYKLIPR